MRLVDTHAHLDAKRFDSDREEVILRALEADVQVITVGTDIESNEQAVRIAQKYGIYAAAGIHPHEAGRFVRDGRLDAQALARLEGLLGEERVVAVGEIGLDYFKDYSPREAQRAAFAAQLELARRRERPVVVHNRESEDDLLRFLSEHGGFGVVHSFTGDGSLAEEILALGFHLGVNGIVTFAKDRELRRALTTIPLNRLLVETDSPFLAPVPKRGRRNEPAFVCHVAQHVAEQRDIPGEELAEATTENAARLFTLG